MDKPIPVSHAEVGSATADFVPATPEQSLTDGTPKSPSATESLGGDTAASRDVSATPADVPGYRILKALGRGSMGAVYQAEQIALKRIVALKVLLPAVDSPTSLARFRTEAEAVARLQHPNIVQIFEVGEWHDRHFFSMEYVDGRSLAERLAHEDLPPPREAAALIRTLAASLHYAHEQGIVHRDVKPANILLTRDGVPKLTDFGLAKRVHVESDETAVGQIVGTPSYMAPEQAQGQAKEAGPAADVYALGAVLYELLTGRPPFKGSSALETVLQVASMERDVVRPTRLQPAIPRDLETICLTCLEKDPRRRYGSAAALADELTRFLEGRPILARPIGTIGRVLKWARREPQQAALAIASVLATLIAFAGITWQWQEAEGARQEASERARREAAAHARERDAHRRTDDAREAAEQTLYFHRIALADRERIMNNIGGADRLLAECPEALRHWEWQYLSRVCHLERSTIRGWEGPISAVAWSPDGTRIAAAGTGVFPVIIWDSATEKIHQRLSGEQVGNVRSIAFSQDGTVFATAAGTGRITVWNAVTGQLVRTMLHEGTRIESMAVSPESTELAWGGGDGLLRVCDIHGKERWSVRAHESDLLCVAWSPRGTQMASGGADALVKLWDRSTGKEVATLRGHTGNVRSVAFSHDGTLLASGGDDHAIRLWDISTGREVQVFRGHTGMVWSVGFGLEGTRVISASEDSTVRVWKTDAGEPLLTLRGHVGGVWSVAVSPDGKRLVSGSTDTTVKVWDAVESREARVFTQPIGIVTAFAFSPDGKSLALGNTNGRVQLREVATGKEIATLRGHRPHVTSVAFSPDGREVVSGSHDLSVKVWDVATGTDVLTLSGHTKDVTTVAWSPGEGRLLASGGRDALVKLWDRSTGKEVATLRGHTGNVRSVAFSHDGTLLASGGDDHTIRLWDVATGREVQVLRGHTGIVWSVAFCSEGEIVSGSSDHTVKIWSSRTGAAVQTLAGHTDVVLTVTVSPDGKRIASGGRDRLIKLWDATTGRELLSLHDHADHVTCLTFSPDGTLLASGSRDRTIRIR